MHPPSNFRTRVIIHSIHGSEKIPSSKECLNKKHTGKEIECLTLNKNKIDNNKSFSKMLMPYISQ